MGGSFLIFFFFNVFLFTLIFWLLTFLGEKYFNKKNTKNRRKFYECGFKSISDFSIKINLNFSIVAVFLVLYDVEFIFLIPFLFNFIFANWVMLLSVMIFILLIFLSLVFDIFYNSFNISL